MIYVECTIVDKNGVTVPDANNELHFKVEGEATIAGVGNGNPMCIEPFKSDKHSSFNGKCLVILQSTKKVGAIHLTISSEGLKDNNVILSSN